MLPIFQLERLAIKIIENLLYGPKKLKFAILQLPANPFYQEIHDESIRNTNKKK